MKTRIDFPFYGSKGLNETNLRRGMVELFNKAQDKFTFGIFTTNATNFHSDGCIYAVKKGDKAPNRSHKNVVFCSEYGSSLPSCYPDGETQFDYAYKRARQFIFDNCGV